MATAIPVMVAEITKRASGGKGRSIPPGDDSEPPEPKGDEASYDKIKRSAVEDLLAAIKDDDADAAMTALSDFHEACYDEEKSETPKQEEDEDAEDKA